MGRIVVDVAELDEDRERLLAAFASHASVALQKARLYWKQLEAAEIASALLEASREQATADSSVDLLARSVEVTARVLGTPRVALFVQSEGPEGELAVRASFGYDAEHDPAEIEISRASLTASEPFTLDGTAQRGRRADQARA